MAKTSATGARDDELGEFCSRAGLNDASVRAVRARIGVLGVPSNDPAVVPHIVSVQVLHDAVEDLRAAAVAVGRETEGRCEAVVLKGMDVVNACGALVKDARVSADRVVEMASAQLNGHKATILNEVGKSIDARVDRAVSGAADKLKSSSDDAVKRFRSAMSEARDGITSAANVHFETKVRHIRRFELASTAAGMVIALGLAFGAGAWLTSKWDDSVVVNTATSLGHLKQGELTNLSMLSRYNDISGALTVNCHLGGPYYKTTGAGRPWCLLPVWLGPAAPESRDDDRRYPTLSDAVGSKIEFEPIVMWLSSLGVWGLLLFGFALGTVCRKWMRLACENPVVRWLLDLELVRQQAKEE